VINIRVQPPPPRPRVSLFWLFVLSLILWSALA
jgi:hypothetical protein